MNSPEPASRRDGWAWLALAALLLAGGVLLVYWRLLLTNRVLGSGDALTYFTPYRDYANAALREGRLPLWNPYLFLGVPFLANPQTAVLYPLHWPFIWLSPAKSLIASFALHLWWASLGAFIYARRVARLDWLPALVVGLIFSLSGYLGAHAGQINQVSAAAWLPWMLWLLESVIRDTCACAQAQVSRITDHGSRINLLALAGLSLAVALQFLAGHTQTSYINLVGLGLAAIWPGVAALLAWSWQRLRHRPAGLDRAALGRAARRLGLLVVAVALGGLLAAVQLLPTWELARQSVRSSGLAYREVVSFSLQPRGLLLTLLPGYGENLAGQFATPAFAEFVAFSGVGALLLAGLAILRRNGLADGRAWLASPAGFVLALALAGFSLALGLYNPLYFLLYKLLPGFDLFRAPARWMLLYSFGVALLAGYGMQSVMRESVKREDVMREDGSRIMDTCTCDGAQRRCKCHGSRITFFLVIFAVVTFLLFQRWPAWWVVALWLATGGAALLSVIWGRRLGRPAGLLLAVLLLAELAGGSLSLDHTRPTAPEAVSSLRSAPVHLLAAAGQAEAAGSIPGRFLSLSGITYDPGDLAEMEQMLAGQLPPQAIYDFVVASKLQEIVAPNLSLLWRLAAVDGYDGGVLPLRRTVDLQTLFVPAEQLAEDGRLREQLQAVPASRLLRLLNVEHVITDKGFDVWTGGVYYDLELSTSLGPGQFVAVDAAGRLEATQIGLYSHLAGLADLPDGAPLAQVEVVAEDGSRQRFQLRAGQDSAEGAWTEAAAHRQPAGRTPWSRHQAGWDYLARFDLAGPTSPAQIVVTSLAPAGQFVLRGISLIDQRTETHASLTMPADGNFRRVHSGDVKVYQNLANLPRAFVVGQAQIAADDAAALAALADPTFEPARSAVLLAGELQAAGLLDAAATLSGDVGGASVRVQDYQPERVALQAELAAPGLLVLGDTWYDGWQVAVDGRPAPLLHANYLFRGVLLPVGSHEVVFEFRPASLRAGALASAAGLLLVAALLVLGRGRGAGR